MHASPRSARRCLPSVLALLASFCLVLGLAASGGGVPASAAVTSCTLAPVVRDKTVNQGVGAYSTLVRGKETLVRFYLSLPACAAGTNASISLTGASLEVRAPSTSSASGTVTAYRPTFPTKTPPSLPPYASAPALDAPADPVFAVPASLLRPLGDAAFTAGFRAVLTWTGRTSSGATVGGTTPATSEFTATKPFERKTGALRMLVVPMGDGSLSYASQFDSVAQSVTQNGVKALARMLPVPDAVGELRAGSTGGVRYTIAPTLLDVKSLHPDSSRFCGRASNFETVKARLGQFLQSYNAANPTAPADRVLGVIKDTLSSGASAGCAEGMAAIGGTQAWVRAIPDTAASRGMPAKPSMTGALMGMEIGHTMGLVPLARANPTDSHHSPNKVADLLSPNRAYNVSLRTFLATNRTAMTLSDSWDNTTTVYEPADWATLLCTLGGTDTAVCDAPGSVGTNEGVPAAPVFVLTGTTDGTAGGTRVLESYFAQGHEEPAATASPYVLVQRDGATELSRHLVPVNTQDSSHEHTDDPSTHGAVTHGLTAVVRFETGADRIELRHGETVLYARDRTDPPVLEASSAGPDVLANFTQDAAAHDTAPALSPDGRWIAWTRGPAGSSDVLVAPVGDRTGATVMGKGGAAAASDPAWHPDGAALAVVVDGAVQRVPVDVTGTRASFGAATTLVPAGLLSRPPSHPSFSSDGSQLAIAADGEVLLTSAAGYDGFTVVSSGLPGVAGSPSWSRAAGDARLVFDYRPGLDGTPGNATTGWTNVPTDGDGSAGDAIGQPLALSGDGRFVVWTGLQSDLVPGDTNGAFDVFVRDRVAGTTERVSVSSTGAQANGSSHRPAISADGRYVAFTTEATNLSASGRGVHLHDRQLRTTRRMDLTPAGGSPDGEPVSLAMDATGAYLAYGSTASNLVPDDTNGKIDVFVTEVATGTTTRASVGAGGTESNGDSGLNTGVAVTQRANAPVVAFGTTASNLWGGAIVDSDGLSDIALRDVAGDTTMLVSRSRSSDTPILAATGSDTHPALSSDGSVVAFQSTSADLVPDDTNGSVDVFRFSYGSSGRVSVMTIERSSVRSDGAQMSSGARNPSISDDGRLVAFDGQDTFDLTRPVSQGVYVRESFGTTRLASLAHDGSPAGDADSGAVSADGGTVGFWSYASGVVPADSNGVRDLFVRGAAVAASQVLLADPRVHGGTTQLALGTDPAFGDGAVAFARGGRVVSVAPDGTGETALTDGTADRRPALGGGRLAFDRPESATSSRREVWATAPSAGGGDGTYTVQSAQPANVRVSLFYDCDGFRLPVAVGLTPAELDAQVDRFLAHADGALLCAGGTLVAVASDGFSLAASPTQVSTTPVAAEDDPPVVALAGRADWSTALQYESVSVTGSARDPEDGVLTGAALSWLVEDAAGTVVRSGSGDQLDLTAPAGPGSTGFVPGDYTITLTASAGGRTASDSVHVQVLADADHDGLSADLETRLAAAGCAGSDADPANAFADCDGDGIANLDDQYTPDGPTTAATTYSATVTLSPDPYAVATAATLSGQVRLTSDRTRSVTGSTVRITEIAGEAVPASAGLKATSWRVKGDIATATFSGTALRTWLTSHGLVGRQVNVEIGGSGTTKRGRSTATFTFTATDSLTTS